MRFSTTSCRRTTSAVKKYYINIVRPRYSGKFFLGLIYAPVGHKVTTILGTVGKAEHDGLLVPAQTQMLAVSREFIEFLHYSGSVVKIINGFKEWHYINQQR